MDQKIESRGARLMKKMAHYSEDMGAVNAGLGDAGLSQIGPPPNGVMAMLKGRKSKQPLTECHQCGSFTEGEGELCMGCGERLPRSPALEQYTGGTAAFTERFNTYRQRQQTIHESIQVSVDVPETENAWSVLEEKIVHLERKIDRLLSLVEST